jgi:hypothetical protein
VTFRKQITCTCKAYPFPHRLSGGKCTIIAYCSRYFYEDRALCALCLCNKQSYCEVVEGLEAAGYCKKVQELEHLHEIKFTTH